MTLTQRAPARERLAYLDWLRVVALVGVFLYHCLQPFSTDDWHVKNAELSEAITIPISFFGTWGIGFFFLISGAGTCLALRWRSTGQYVAERLTRLWVQLARYYGSHYVRRIGEVNGEPALLNYFDGALYSVTAIDTDGERILAVYTVANPDKLAALAVPKKI